MVLINTFGTFFGPIHYSNVCVRGVSKLTPFLGFAYVWLIQELHVFQWADKKTGPTKFTKFSAFVGDTKYDILT